MKRIDEEGFSLIEILVSFTILSGAIILALQISAGGFRALQTARLRTHEIEIVTAELGRVRGQQQIKPGVQQGTTNGTSWRIVVEEVLDHNNGSSVVKPLLVKAYGAGPEPIAETIVIARPKL